MLRYFTDTDRALKRLLADNGGVASFEYVVLAACIIAITAAVFSAGGTGSIQATLSSALNTIAGAVTSAVGS
ncbi:hypothetical protein J6500_12800 [Bradyrhizobium sp. WSM 1704]|uniref:hypothetical protein n=1 Tax=Bradyrhizobium semiaridum TaxID=2821404 RepID=UPI001CE35D3C|nr:hypothetical protein [Bradyrhizobium semiaridum]MCA6122768.1 hypothetical protein [Bradyrhizobium semiaridum]